MAPQHVALDLLRAEGFSDVRYVRTTTPEERLRGLAGGESQMLITFVSSLITRLDAGDPLLLLAGSHVGRFEVFATSPRSPCPARDSRTCST